MPTDEVSEAEPTAHLTAAEQEAVVCARPGKPRERETGSHVVGIAGIAEFIGPIPPPKLLEGYERILPGSADRIIKMAEETAQHRRTLLNWITKGEISAGRWGQILGFAIGMTGMIAGAYVAIRVPGWSGAASGSAISGVTVLGLVTIFVTGRRARRSSQDNEPSP